MTWRSGRPTFEEERGVRLGCGVEANFVTPNPGLARTAEREVDEASVKLGEGEHLAGWRADFEDIDVGRVFREQLQPEVGGEAGLD